MNIDETLEAYKNYIVESITLKPTDVMQRKINKQQATQAIKKAIQEASKGTFTKEQLIAWADEQEPFADYWMKDKTGAEAYKIALKHLKHHLEHPIKDII